MRIVLIGIVATTAALTGSPLAAQPLEQSFAFGAPPDVLGNNRVRVPRPARPDLLGPRRGDVQVRFGRRGYAQRPSRFRAE